MRRLSLYYYTKASTLKQAQILCRACNVWFHVEAWKLVAGESIICTHCGLVTPEMVLIPDQSMVCAHRSFAPAMQFWAN